MAEATSSHVGVDVVAPECDSVISWRASSDGTTGSDVQSIGQAGEQAAPTSSPVTVPFMPRVAIAAALALLFAFVSWVQLTNLSHWPATFFDEGTYISNAWAVPRGALSNYTYGYGHPPLAWLLVSLWTSISSLFGPTLYSVAVGRQLMALLAIVSCVLLYVLARRLGMGRIFAAAAVALFARCRRSRCTSTGWS